VSLKGMKVHSLPYRQNSDDILLKIG